MRLVQAKAAAAAEPARREAAARGGGGGGRGRCAIGRDRSLCHGKAILECVDCVSLVGCGRQLVDLPPMVGMMCLGA